MPATTVHKFRVVADASTIGKPDGGYVFERHCTCCARYLKGRIAYLELDQRTNTYHDFGGVPLSKSQGWFPFGLACARKQIAKAPVSA